MRVPGKDIHAFAAGMVEALNQRDPDALLALVRPDYEFHSRLMAVEGRAYRGREGFCDYFRDLGESFTDLRWSLDEVVGERGDEAVVVFRFTARGRESSTPVDVLAPQVWTFRDGRPWRNVIYASRQEALEAAGLQEERSGGSGVGDTGLEPVTSALSRRRSPS